MAYDKAVDSAQLETALTATANAIREKAGNTDACAWDATTGFASLIAAIQAGGGGIDGKRFLTGMVTPASDGYTIKVAKYDEIVNDFGGTLPEQLTVMWWEETYTEAYGAKFAMTHIIPSLKGAVHYWSNGLTRTSMQNVCYLSTSSGFTLVTYSNTAGYFKTTTSYRWLLVEG